MSSNPGITGPDARDVASGLIGNSSQSQQFFDRLLTPPTIAREALYVTLIDTLVAAGVWALLDCLYVFAAFDHGTALTNLINGNFRSKWTISSGTFTQDQGLTPNGTSFEINYGFDPTSGGNFARNSACLFAWNRAAGATSAGSFISQNGTVTARIQFTAGSAQWSINNAGVTSVVQADASGLWLTNRDANFSALLSRNNSSISTSAVASVALNAGAFVAGGGTDGTAQIAAVGCGGSLTAGQQTSLYNALNTYLVAVGAA